MQKNITNMLDYLPVYMKAALKKEEILLNDLYFSKRHTDIEYTNIAAVMMQRSNAQYVMSIDNWKKVFPEIMEIQKKLERPVTVLVPDVREGVICFTTYKVFDIEQLDIPKQAMNDFMSEHKSHLALMIKEYTKQKIINLCGDKKYWRGELLNTYLQQFVFYEKAGKQLKGFYYRCLKAAFFDELDFPGKNELKIGIEISDSEVRRIYKNIHELIAKFHFFFSDFVSNRAKREKERWEKLMILRDSREGIEDRIKRAVAIKQGIRGAEESSKKKKEMPIEYYEEYDTADNPPAYSDQDEYMNDLMFGKGGH